MDRGVQKGLADPEGRERDECDCERTDCDGGGSGLGVGYQPPLHADVCIRSDHFGGGRFFRDSPHRGHYRFLRRRELYLRRYPNLLGEITNPPPKKTGKKT